MRRMPFILSLSGLLAIGFLAPGTPLAAGPPSSSSPMRFGPQPTSKGMLNAWMDHQNWQREAAQREARRLAAKLQGKSAKNALQVEAPIAEPREEAWSVAYNPEQGLAADGDLVVTFRPKSRYRVEAWERTTGKARWEAKIDGDVEDGPYLTPDLVLVATRNYTVVALDRKTGKARYTANLDPTHHFSRSNNQWQWVFLGFPEPERLLVATYGRGAEYAEVGGSLTALDPRTGARQWEHALDMGAVHPPLRLEDGRIVIAGQGWLHLFDAEGKPLWKRDLGEDGLQMGCEADGRYTFMTSKKLRAVTLADGKPLWEARAGLGPFLGPGRAIVVGSAPFSFNARMTAVDAATGAAAWSYDDFSIGRPAVADDLLVVWRGDALVALNTGNGTEAWKVALPAKPDQPPLLIAGRLLVWYQKGKQSSILSLDPATGRTLWDHTVESKPGPGMFLADAAGILFPGADKLVCLR